MRNLWKYYPNIKGTITGVVLCAFGFSAVILNKVSNMIINPDHVGIDRKTEFYPEFIGLRVPRYYLVTSIIMISIGLISSLLIFEYEEKKEDKVEDYLTQKLSVIKLKWN